MGRFSLARKLATSLLVAFVVGALAATAVRLRPSPDPDGPELAGASLGAIDRLETSFVDALIRRESDRLLVGPEIVLVTIDEASVKRARETAGGWPWPRAYLGKLVQEMRALGARLVVLDTSFPDASRIAADDARLAQSFDAAGGVVAGFSFAEAPEEGILEPGRWAVLQGSYATRGAALLGAGPLLAGGARPYLLTSGGRVEVWLGGYRDRAVAQKDLERLKVSYVGREPTLRELKAEETLDRVTVDVLFAERNALSFGGGAGHELKTFQNLQPPVVELAASSAGFGNLRLERDQDGVVRGVRHLWRHEGRYYPSLALAAALALEGGKAEASFDGDRLRVGRLRAPVDAWGITRLRYYGRADKDGTHESPYPVVPVLSIVRSAVRRAEGKSLDEKLEGKLKDKVVFVSFEAGACDRPDTPLSRSSLRASPWATALDNLLRGDGVVRASADQDAAVAFTMALLGAFVSLLFTRGTRPTRTLVLELIVAAAVGAAYTTWVWRAYQSGLWVSAVVPMLSFGLALAAATAVNTADERQAVRHIREVLGRYALPTLVEQLLRRPHHLAAESVRMPITAMVVELHGWALAAELEPKALIALADEYLGDVAEAVAAFKGQIDAVAGPQVVAFWGAPLPNKKHASEAARCALRIRQLLAARAEVWKQRHQLELGVSVGLCSGDLVVGYLRGRGAFQPRFVVIGQAMAHAERLARAAPDLRAQVLAGESTFEAVREEISAREIDLLRDPARPRPMRVIELCGEKKGQPEADREFLRRFEEAVVSFRKREFAQALDAFAVLAKERPADGPTAMYVDRCRVYLDSPPGEEWEGVFEPPAS
ncbi:MAG TPA: adenylate/guanylate cyclase domain-containing protein [Myxococcales bacterium]